MSLDPNDAPDGFQAVKGEGLSCESCWFMSSDKPCPEKSSAGALRCMGRNRDDGCMVVFKRNETP